MDETELAIIKNVGIGMRNCHYPVLWFDVHIAEGEPALQVLNWAQAEQLIKDYHLYDVKNLEGKACLVSKEGPGPGYLHYHSAWKP